jgi:hypothetical protein
MKLTTRIERLERLEGMGEPLKLTIAFFDSILDGTISDDEFARVDPALDEMFPKADLGGLLAVGELTPARQTDRRLGLTR